MLCKMADSPEEKSGGGIEEVLNFLKVRGIKEDILDNFDREKMDVEAVLYATDESLQDLGLKAKGDIFALKAFCQRQTQMHQKVGDDYEERKRKLVEELQRGREKVKSRKTEKASSSHGKEKDNTSELQKQAKKDGVKSRKVTLGWMHYSAAEKRFISVRLNNGGGTRRIDVPAHSSKEDLIAEGKKLFFPDGESVHGKEEEMIFDLANFRSEQIEDFLKNGETTVPFTVQSYSEKHKLTLTRLYLTSRSKTSLSATSEPDALNEDDADLMTPAFGVEPAVSVMVPNKDQQDSGKAWRMTYASTSLDGESSYSDSEGLSWLSDDMAWLDRSLLDTSEERQQLLKEQEESLQQSLEIDRQKEEEKRQQEMENGRLEAVRLSRSLRVPAEPEVGTLRVRIAVHHVTNGRLVRYFSTEDKMMSVYDWIGSLAKEPENFQLCSSPEVVAMPSDPVSNSILYMQVTENSVLLLEDSEITFKGYGWCGREGRQPRTSFNGSEFDVTSQPPEDEDRMAEEKREIVKENYSKLQKKRKKALDAQEGNVSIIVSKENIVHDLISVYKDPSILEKNVSAVIEGAEATGDGVLREVYSLFWSTFLSQSDGDSEHPIPVLPDLNQEDYVSIGRILTHQYVLCGVFPVKVSQASVQHTILGNVTDECKIESFLRLLPPRERECLSRALAGDGSFPTEEMIDLFDDHNIRQLPTADNIRSLVLFVATAEFVTKPFLCLTSMRAGMGHLWDNVTREEIVSLYEMSVPTAAGIVASLALTPENAKEAKVFRWLERYLKGSSNEILAKFLRFCTATDVLLPDHSISVLTEVMPPAAVRPKSYTCFRRLILPRNYQSYSQMRNNLDFYLRDCSIWDLKD